MGSGLRSRGRPKYPDLFTPAEQRVLSGLDRDLTYQQIAGELGVSYDTVKYHVSNMLAKAEVASRTELVRFARSHPGRRWLRAGWLVPLAASLAAGFAILVVVAVLVVRFGGQDEADPAAGATEVPTTAATPIPSTTPAATATPEQSAVPKTGVSVVDSFIAAMLSGDIGSLMALVDYREIGCVSQTEGIGSPPICEPGQAPGSPVQVIGFSNCEGGFSIQADVLRSFEFFTTAGPRLFSVSRRSGGGYAVLFTFERWADGTTRQGSATGTAFLLSNSGLNATVSGCGVSARTLALQYPDYLILPPPLPAVPAGTPKTGVASVDRVINAITIRDLQTLRDLLQPIDVGCGPERWTPYCSPDQPQGTLIPSMLIRQCADDQFWLAMDGMLTDIDWELGPNPTVAAVARGSAPESWIVVFDGSLAPAVTDGGRALVLSDDGRITAVDRGCKESAGQLAARYTDFLLAPKANP